MLIKGRTNDCIAVVELAIPANELLIAICYFVYYEKIILLTSETAFVINEDWFVLFVCGITIF